MGRYFIILLFFITKHQSNSTITLYSETFCEFALGIGGFACKVEENVKWRNMYPYVY
jgi:hypothetical protein